ncbi:hypothetical protein R5R35_013695 [Gryllus longicercus]|uniref:Enhancer of mRNA-decapping protein 4 n=1 Tax=Gryllus longicercus TaxID=2509291 RepID=A0AAN9W0I8_9ORTH
MYQELEKLVPGIVPGNTVNVPPGAAFALSTGPGCLEEQHTMSVTKSAKTGYPQIIHFSGHDDENCKEVVSHDVKLVPSSGEHESGSSKVKLRNIVDFSWEHRFYTGQLLAVHMGGKYVAYGIKSVGKGNGVVRIVNRVTNERSLLKGMQGMIQDIAFAHIPQEVVLAYVDEFGSLLVYTVQESDNKILCTLLLHVEHRKEEISGCITHRVIWCPFIPDEEEETSQDSSPYDDVAKLLVLTRGCKAELWNVSVVVARHGNGPLEPEIVEEGFLEVNEHSQPIVDAAFSPDGVALATASLDGDIKFFQVYMHTGERPRCLHHWQPHGGKPVSALFFLDNHKSYNPHVQFWKFAITGAENNTELKLWSCESWSCLQTIRFTPENSKKNIALKAGLDLGAGYLLLSDIYNKLLYIFQIYKNSDETCAYIQSVSEFSLPYPILSFGIVDAGLRTVRSSGFEEFCSDGEEEQLPSVQAVVVRMYLVQPKSLQECHISFQPSGSSGSNVEKLETLSGDSLLFKDGFSDLSRSILDKSDADGSVHEIATNRSSQLNLMTPDAFNSPAKKESPGEILSPKISHHSDSSPHVPPVLESTLSASPSLLNSIVAPCDDSIQLSTHSPGATRPLATSEPLEPSIQREGCASGGSSPSREVQQILSLKASSDYLPDNIVDVMDPVVPAPPKVPSPKESHQYGSLSKEKVDENGWPHIPLSLMSDMHKSVAGDDTSSKRSSSGAPGADNDAQSSHLLKQNQRIESTLASLTEQISALAEAQQLQQTQLQEVHADVQQMQQQVTSLAAADAAFVSHLDSALAQQQVSTRTVLDGLAHSFEDTEQKKQDAILSALPQMLGKVVTSTLQDLVVSEFKNNLTPAVVGSIEPLKRQLHVEMTQKLSATDHLLKENITKLVQSKSVLEVLSNTMVLALQPAMQACFKDVFSSLVLPSFEKACQSMFQQINDTFSRGTQEYLQNMDSHFDKQRRQHEKSRELLNQLQSMTEALRASTDSLVLQLRQEVQRQVQAGIASIQESVNRTVGEAVKEHISKGFHAQKSLIEDSVITAVRSRAVTPAPHILDAHLQQTQVLQLIAQGQINAAFQQALSASDLNLVVFVCEKVNPAQVFNQSPCPLQQHVLLSLIQQLSADMTNHTELKHKYLEEAVMNLDPGNIMTREHLPSVISNLQRQLAAYMQSNPNNKITRSMRMLHMATQSLLNS